MPRRRKKILVAPLDWGLGHATRCVPVVKALLARECEVLIASSGRSLSLLRKEFPMQEMFRLTAYDPEYPSGGNMLFKLGLQVPKFMRAISKENSEIEKIVFEKEVDAVISDNRYGCYSKNVHSVFIGHQLNILMPEGWDKTQKWVNAYNHSRIKKFKEVWVPAPVQSPLTYLVENTNGFNVKHVGYLSRLEKRDMPIRYKVCMVCSGPEPQRTFLEDIFTKELEGREFNTILIKGLTEKLNPYFNKDMQHMVANYLTTDEINNAFCESEIIVARSGYSTVMDLARLGKKAIFIPTPGQTEQEHLARELLKQGVAFSMAQQEFNLDIALKESEKFTGFANFTYDDSLLEKAIDSLL